MLKINDNCSLFHNYCFIYFLKKHDLEEPQVVFPVLEGVVRPPGTGLLSKTRESAPRGTLSDKGGAG